MAKMTYATAIDNGIDVLKRQENAEQYKETIERLNDLKVALAKRNGSGADKKPTKAQEDNARLRNQLYDLLLTEPDGMNPTDIAGTVHLSVQKISGQLKIMVDDEKRIRREQKGKKVLYYAIVEDAVAEDVPEADAE